LNGDDLRRDPLEVRKATLRSMLAKAGLGLRFNEHLEGDGPTVFAHACKMGLEGIVSKRKDSMYRSGRSPDWLKMKNPAAPAVKREDEEDWGQISSRRSWSHPQEPTCEEWWADVLQARGAGDLPDSATIYSSSKSGSSTTGSV